MNIVAIIPARYASTRLPGKPLALIGNKSMIERTYLQVKQVIEDVWIATCDKIIADEVLRFGGKVIMTSELHNSGTERCAEAVKSLPYKPEIVVNVQSDEPFISPADLKSLCDAMLADHKCQIATLIQKYNPAEGLETLTSPDNPKVVIDNTSHALYFSRSVIPFVRNYPLDEWSQKANFYLHQGTYAFRYDTLLRLTSLPPSDMETAESLEQLRWLAGGFTIRTICASTKSLSIDTAEDLAKANQLITNNPL